MKFSGVTILQGVEFPIFPIHFAWALQQQRYCAACDEINDVYANMAYCWTVDPCFITHFDDHILHKHVKNQTILQEVAINDAFAA